MMSETEAKSISTDHAVALRNGNVFVFFPLCRENKEPKNPSKLAAILNNLKNAADNMIPGLYTVHTREPPLDPKIKLTRIFIKYMHDIVL